MATIIAKTVNMHTAMKVQKVRARESAIFLSCLIGSECFAMALQVVDRAEPSALFHAFLLKRICRRRAGMPFRSTGQIGVAG